MFIQTRDRLINYYDLYILFVENLGDPGARRPGARAPLLIRHRAQI